MRVALNLEQLLTRPPGGVGRYTAELARLLPGPDPDGAERIEVVPFVARHRRGTVDAALGQFGLTGLEPVSLLLPRPILYDTWNTLAAPPLSLLHRALRDVDLVHAPSLAVPPRAGHAPLIVTVHDAAPLLFPETYPAAWSLVPWSRPRRRGPPRRPRHRTHAGRGGRDRRQLPDPRRADPHRAARRRPRPRGVRRRSRRRARPSGWATSPTCCGSARSSRARTCPCCSRPSPPRRAPGSPSGSWSSGRPGWSGAPKTIAAAAPEPSATGCSSPARIRADRLAALYHGALAVRVPEPPRGIRPARAGGDGPGRARSCARTSRSCARSPATAARYVPADRRGGVDRRARRAPRRRAGPP